MKLKIHSYGEYNKLFDILLLTSIGSTIFCLCKMLSFESYWYFSFLPVAYVITRFIRRKSIYSTAPGMITYEIVCFFRFVILPIVVLSHNSVSKYAAGYEHLGSAVVLMIYELFCTTLIFLFYKPSIKQDDQTRMLYSSGNKRLVFVLSVLVVGLLYIQNRSLTGNLMIFSGVLNTSAAEQLSETSSVVSILWQSLLCFIFVYVIWSVYEKSQSSKSKVIYTIASSGICIVYYLIIFTGQVSISRWYVMVSAIASIVWLITLYPNNKTAIISTVGIPFVVVLVMVSVLKSGGLTALSYSRYNQINNLLTPEFVDTYFAGPVNVNNAITMKSNSNVGISSLFYDIINNMPIVTNIIDRTHSSAYAYNHLLGRTDQIIPLIGQSFTWFGYFLSPVLSMLYAALFIKYDFEFLNRNGIDRYCYGFVAAWCGATTILNATIWFAWLYSKIIPMLLLFWVIRKLMGKKSASTS